MNANNLSRKQVSCVASRQHRSRLMVVVAALQMAKCFCRTPLKFDQSDGASGGVRLLMFPIAHVRKGKINSASQMTSSHSSL